MTTQRARIAEGSLPDINHVWAVLDSIPDPEIPVLSLVELKVVRDVRMHGRRLVVEMTPTFLGCPALEYMKQEIRRKMLELGFDEVEVTVTLTPPWSTDLLDASAREKLRLYGIAPPPRKEGNLSDLMKRPVACPSCQSLDTRMQSPFGATLCKQLYICESCRQPFERFKAL